MVRIQVFAYNFDHYTQTFKIHTCFPAWWFQRFHSKLPVTSIDLWPPLVKNGSSAQWSIIWSTHKPEIWYPSNFNTLLDILCLQGLHSPASYFRGFFFLIWGNNIPSMSFLPSDSVFTRFSVWPLVVINDVWPPPKLMGFLSLCSIWGIYMPSMRLTKASLLERSCFQGWHLTSDDPIWPSTSTRINTDLSLPMGVSTSQVWDHYSQFLRYHVYEQFAMKRHLRRFSDRLW